MADKFACIRMSGLAQTRRQRNFNETAPIRVKKYTSEMS